MIGRVVIIKKFKKSAIIILRKVDYVEHKISAVTFKKLTISTYLKFSIIFWVVHFPYLTTVII